MKHEDLPQRWKDKISEYLAESGSDYSKKLKRFSGDDFSESFDLKITFEDDSNAFFRYAFYWIDEENKEVAVFTEHCGYHIFYLSEILLEAADWQGKIIKTDDYRTE